MRDFESDRKLCDAATKGPWKAVGIGYRLKGFPQVELNTPEQHYFNVNFERDAEFIAAARDGWPDAIDRIAELENELLQKTQQVDELLQKVQRFERMLVFAMGFSICNGCRHFGDDKLCGRGIMPMGSTCRKNGYKGWEGGK